MGAEEATTPNLEELAGRTRDAFDRRDVDAAVAYYSEDAVWDVSAVGLGAFQGRDAIRGMLEDWLGPFEEMQQVFEEFADLGNGVAFAVVFQQGRLRGSSSAVTLRYAIMTIWANELIQRQATYTDIDEGRAAAERLAEERLSEQAASPILVERVRMIFEAADRGDFDGILAFYADDAAWVMSDEIETFVGLDAIRRHYEEWWAAYANFRLEPVELVGLGNGVVFSVARQGGQLAGGGANLSEDVALVYEWSNDLVVRESAFFDIEKGRAIAERLAGQRADG